MELLCRFSLEILDSGPLYLVSGTLHSGCQRSGCLHRYVYITLLSFDWQGYITCIPMLNLRCVWSSKVKLCVVINVHTQKDSIVERKNCIEHVIF